MATVGIVGGTGYTGAELLRLLAHHPQVELALITSRQAAGTPVAEWFPNLRGHVDLAFSAPDAGALAGCDLVFFATPNGTAMEQVPALVAAGTRVVDLAADFRLKDPQVWERWYGMRHACPDVLAEAVYGLPELNRAAIREARVVGNPGCYPTAVTLGLLPLLTAGVVDGAGLVADAKSGVSGAGRKATEALLMGEVGESFKAYSVPGHRHAPEIRAALGQAAGAEVGLVFVPHLVPMVRGIHATLYAPLTDPGADLPALFARHYRNEPFVDVLEADAHPETRGVKGSNLCRIAAHRPEDGATAVVLSVIDNLVKGAAGQAVQNMNLMLGFPEATGLDHVPLQP